MRKILKEVASYLIIILCIVGVIYFTDAVIGKPRDQNTRLVNMYSLPDSSRIIHEYGNYWVSWKLDDNCFLSGHNNSFTSIPCK